MKPLICAHGIGMHAGFFARQAKALAPRPVIGFNMPGFDGEPLAGATSFAGLAAKLSGQIETLEGPVHVLGHSMGGMIALELAATRPDQIASLILCNTTPAFGGKDDSFKREFVSARLAPLENGKTMAQMAPASVRAMSGDTTAEDDLAFMADLMGQTPEAAYRTAIECLVTFDRRDALESLAMPVLLIGGEDDPASPAKTMRRMAEKIPDAECHILPGRHMTPVEQSGETNRILAAFLTRTEAP